MDPASGIELGLRTPFELPPVSGTCTVELTIRNGSPRDGQWEVTMDSANAYWWAHSAHHTLAVESGATRTFLMVAPLSWMGPASSADLRLRGPGTTREPVNVCQHEVIMGHKGGSLFGSQTFAMSESLGGGVWDGLEQALKAQNRAMVGSRFVPADLPSDARSYAGFSLLFLRQEEWAGLPAGVREAVNDWVALGGHLWLVGGPASDTRVGFGLTSTWPLAPGGALDVTKAQQQILASETLQVFPQNSGPTYVPWELPDRLVPPELNGTLVFFFMLTVAVLIGPLNLFWFARGRRRHRVYWTTPLLSAGAALALLVMIVARDGTGGNGLRWTAVAVVPETHRAAIVQEQVARTGMLRTTQFRSGDVFLARPLATGDWPTLVGSPRMIESAGDLHSGWFRSRSVQAHYIEAVRPTRARVQVRPAEALEVLSSIEGVLDDLFVVDAAGEVWHAADVPAGRRVFMKPSDQYTAWFDAALKGAGPMGRSHLEGLKLARGYFYAGARQGAAIETLPSIHWTQDRLLYVGPVEALP